MAYRVLWAPEAEKKLERILAASPDAQALADAARTIDAQLLSAPYEFGESRYEQIRIGFILPFGVQFEVMDDVQTVVVHDLWRIDRK